MSVILSWTLSYEVLRQAVVLCPNARWVHIVWAGLNNLLSPELEAHPAVLTNGRGVFSDSLGEWVLGAILYFAKDFPRLVRNQRAGRWDQFEIDSVAGRTVGIVGYGDIGRAVARRCRAMDMRILGLTRRGALADKPDEFAERVFALGELTDMIEKSDYLVVAAPLTPESRGMIGDAELAAMKPEAVLINVGRGPIVREDALVQALREKRIKGAALDVFAQEPLPEGHAFYELENVLLSPHCADRTHGWLGNAMQLFLDNLERYRRGEPLLNVVQKEFGY